MCRLNLAHGDDVRFGSKADICGANGMSALPPKADMCVATKDVRFGPKSDMTGLFDHLAGEAQNRGGYFHPKRLCCPQIDDKFKVTGLING